VSEIDCAVPLASERKKKKKKEFRRGLKVEMGGEFGV